MTTSEKVWIAISVGAILFGIGAGLVGYWALSPPCMVIGALILWTTVDNFKKPR